MKADDFKTILKLARSLHPSLIKLRRKFHQRPELSFEEFETTRLLKDALRQLGLKEFPLKTPTGCVFDLQGAKSGPVVAVRSDIDALPVLEKTGLPFSSRIEGRMHACGHDTHMATVFGVAKLLSRMKSGISGTVRFFFQHAEEQPPGGARDIIAAGALEKPKVSMVLGLHVDPRVPTGKIGLRDGVTMASVSDIDITIEGKSGHAARPHDAVDALLAATEVVGALQNIVSREFDPLHPVVITVGQLNAGTARNVIAGRAELKVTIRTLNAGDARRAFRALKRTVNGICKSRGARCEITTVADYPPLSNSARVNKLIRECYTGLFGPGKIVETDKVLGGEDFACYLEKVPGAMFRLGIRNPKIGATENWHSDRFIVDEEAIFYGVAAMSAAALAALEAGAN